VTSPLRRSICGSFPTKSARAVFRIAKKMNGAPSSSRSPARRSAIRAASAEYATNVWPRPSLRTGPACVHSGRPLPGICQEVRCRRTGETNAVKIWLVSYRGRLLQHRYRHIDPGRHLQADRAGAAGDNFGLSSEIAAFIRDVEPKDVTVSIGGEIGEVGGTTPRKRS